MEPASKPDQPPKDVPSDDKAVVPPEPTSTSPPPSAPTPVAPPPSAVVVGGGVVGQSTPPTGMPPLPKDPFAPDANPLFASKSKKRFPHVSGSAKVVIAVVILILGFAGYYFLYLNNPSVIYSQSLGNTAKGYDKLIDYIDQESKKDYKGYTGNGTFRVDSSTFKTDGKISLKGNDKDSQFKFDVGLGATRVEAEALSFSSASDIPDIYVKASGLKGLGSLLGTPELDAQLAVVDDTWIVIDHTLFETYQASLGASASTQANSTSPSQAQIMDGLRAFGTVNQEYLWSTKEDKAILKVVKKVGREKVDDHNTYHYEVALNRANVKKYLKAQKTALMSSKLGTWIKANDYESMVNDIFDEMQQSANNIKASDTFELWTDVDKRLVYKVRFTDTKNSAENYVDLGLDYKGGDSYPFFLTGSSKEGDFSSLFTLVTTLNANSGAMDFKLTAKFDGGESAENFSLKADFTYKPTNDTIKIDKPADAKPLAEVLTELGYPDLLDQLAALAALTTPTADINLKAADTERQADLKALQTQLEAFYAQNGFYPSFAELNNPTWREANMKSLNPEALKDPTGLDANLSATPAANVYAYQPFTTSATSCEANSSTCARFTLTATLTDGPYVINDLAGN